jgi:hypothetical protein
MDEVLKEALKSAARVYKLYLSQVPDGYDGAETQAYIEATNWYINESKLDPKPARSVLTAKWRKLGWWPPIHCTEEHRNAFFLSLKERVESERPWDYPPVSETSIRSRREPSLELIKLIDDVRETIVISKNYSEAVKNLNEFGILTIHGKPWTDQLLCSFRKTHFKDDPPLPMGKEKTSKKEQSEEPVKETVKKPVTKPVKEEPVYEQPLPPKPESTTRICHIDAENFGLLEEAANRSGLSVDSKLNKMLYVILRQEKQELGLLK